MSKNQSTRRIWLTERELFKDLPYISDPKKAALIKRREQVALDKLHKEHLKSLEL
jgi:hypothetical protein